jgi:hypothetical protein
MGLGNMEPGLMGLSTRSFPVAPSDSVNHASDCRYIYVGGTGNVALVNLDDSVVTYVAVPAGAMIMCTSKRINATGTTATNMVGHR